MEQQILWKKFLKGDKHALSLIFRIYFDDLYAYGLKLSFKQDIVEDSIQDLFYKLWKNRENLNEVKNIKFYLLKALRRHILDNLTWNSTYLSIESNGSEIGEIQYSHEDFLITEQLNKEKREKLINTLNSLSKSQKEAIYLRYFRNYNFKMIAGIMNISIQSVRNSIHRGITALRGLNE